MDPGDAYWITWWVWSQVGLLPGLVAFTLAVLLFSLLDRAIGHRIEGRWRRRRLDSGLPRLSAEAADECADLQGDGVGADDCGSSGFSP